MDIYGLTAASRSVYQQVRHLGDIGEDSFSTATFFFI